MPEHRRFEGRRHQRFQIAPPDVRVGVLAGNHFALLGNADLSGDAPGRLRKDGLVAGAAPAPDRSAAAVKQPQLHAVALEHFDQFDFRLEQLPVRREETAVLVAVGITQHHLLHAAAARQQLAVVGIGEQIIHDRTATPQIADGLEQRNDVEFQPRGFSRMQ